MPEKKQQIIVVGNGIDLTLRQNLIKRLMDSNVEVLTVDDVPIPLKGNNFQINILKPFKSIEVKDTRKFDYKKNKHRRK
jgi:hypothetical protein